jgi:hypothetical protein
MQRRAFEVQLAAPERYESAEVAVDLGAITAPSLIVSGGLDLPDCLCTAADAITDVIQSASFME